MKNINAYKNTKGEVWLNVASSTHVLDDFVNLDNNVFLHFLSIFTAFQKLVPRKYWSTIDLYNEAKKKALLIRHDCRKPLFFADNSVDHILCSHFLEHVYPREMEVIVSDFHRVLKPKATLHIIVPDLKAQAEQYLESSRSGESLAADRFIETTLLSKESRGSLKYRVLESLGAFGLQHQWMYDLASMTKKLQAAGFRILEKNNTPSNQYRFGDDSVHVAARKE